MCSQLLQNSSDCHIVPSLISIERMKGAEMVLEMRGALSPRGLTGQEEEAECWRKPSPTTSLVIISVVVMNGNCGQRNHSSQEL